ncbi:Family with sequence similarity 65 member A [Dermatophagoides farinae]|uniref:Family with sequence similarity 65 member A n=1 Tax=Dermatophagoides farinae TaxID=6954 RepID=A0A922I6B5_DERFA|nr:Family with sequence similarity 65 member A [Dermatophagoides farinae]
MSNCHKDFDIIVSIHLVDNVSIRLNVMKKNRYSQSDYEKVTKTSHHGPSFEDYYRNKFSDFYHAPSSATTAIVDDRPSVITELLVDKRLKKSSMSSSTNNRKIMRHDNNVHISSQLQFGGIGGGGGGGGCMMPFQCHNINVEQQQHDQQQLYRTTTVTDCHKDDVDDMCEDHSMNMLNKHSDHRKLSPNIVKVRSKIITLANENTNNGDENKCSTITMNIKSSSSSRQPLKSNGGGGSSTTSGCSTQSSSSSISMPSALQLFRNQSAANMLIKNDDRFHLQTNNSLMDVKEVKDEMSSPNLSSWASRRHCSLTLSSGTSLSSSSSISSKPSPSIRTSGTQWENVGDFIESYEHSLLQCLSSIQQQWIHQNSNISSTSRIIDDNNHNKNDCDDDDHSANDSHDVNDKQQHFHSTSSNNGHNSYENGDCIKHTNQTLQQSSNQNHVNMRSWTSSPNQEDNNNRKHSCYNVNEPNMPEKNFTTDSDSSSAHQLQLRDWIRIQLAKVAHLRQQYEHGNRCQEALVKMAKLSTNSSNRCRKNCYREWRSNERMLQSLAAKLQLMIGSFEIRVENIEGWARICPRDYYELEFRHGQHRQILRVKIVGFSSIAYYLQNKRNEVWLWRSLAVWPARYRYVDIGTTSISLAELLQSVAKQCPLLVDCNPSGSLKLRLNCQWNPNCQDDINIEMDKKESTIRRSSRRLLSSPLVQSTGRLIRRGSWMTHSEKSSSMMKRKCSDQLEQQQQQRGSFGINKNIARSLLSLPTFISSSDLSDASGTHTLPFRIKAIESNHHNDGVDDDDENNECISSSDSWPHYSLRPCSQTSFSPSSSQIETKNQLESMVMMLKTSQASLQDHYGQSIEITLMSQTVTRLITLYERLMTKLTKSQPHNQDEISDDEHSNNLSSDNDNECLSHDQHQTNEFIEQAFEFLDHSDTSDHDNYRSKTRILASFDSNEYERMNRPHLESSPYLSKDQVDINELIFQWNRLLAIHLESATEQLNYVGTWILKSREQCALFRLQADTFAMEQIYLILSSIFKYYDQNRNFHFLKNQPFGQDDRVLELVRHLCPSNHDYSLIFSFDQFFHILSSMMHNYILIKESSINDCEEIDTLFQHSSRCCRAQNWLPYFMCAPFFELNLFDRHNYHCFSKIDGSMKQTRIQPMQLADFFHTAFDLNYLMAKIRTIKWPLLNVEKILFGKFDPQCGWLPPDLTLLLFNLLYEHHYMHESTIRKNCHSRINYEYSPSNSARSLGEVKKSDRLRELSRLINQWLMYQWQQSRFEIREHILAGLESSCPSTRQASCYGIMHLFCLMQRIQSPNEPSFMAMKVFCGKEMDCLLYLSVEDPDNRVRDEAQNSLQYLSSSLGQQMESRQMSFILPRSYSNRAAKIRNCPTSSPKLRNSSPQSITMFRNGHSWVSDHSKNAMPITVSNPILRTSMPNLSSLANDMESIRLK